MALLTITQTVTVYYTQKELPCDSSCIFTAQTRQLFKGVHAFEIIIFVIYRETTVAKGTSLDSHAAKVNAHYKMKQE